MRQYLDEKLSSIPEAKLNGLNVLGSLITIGMFLIGLVSFVIKLFSGENILPFFNRFVLLNICLLGLILVLFSKVLKYRKIQQENRDAVTRNFYDLLHDFRNLHGEIKVMIEKGTLTESIVYEKIHTYALNAVDRLSNIFKSYSQEEVAACIKLIDPDGSHVSTFARSNNSDRDRLSNDKKPALIAQNTDFKYIIDGSMNAGDSIFYQPDLVKYDRELKKINKKYENTRDDWAKYYKATIVAPIRIANMRSTATEEEDCFDILGFISVDSLSIYAFPKSQEKYYRNLIRSFAALLYDLFNMYRELINELNKKNYNRAVNRTLGTKSADGNNHSVQAKKRKRHPNR